MCSGKETRNPGFLRICQSTSQAGRRWVCPRRPIPFPAGFPLNDRVDTNAEDITPLVKQAESLRESGDIAAARDVYRAVLARVPDEEFSTLGLGVCARRDGDHEQALEYHRRAQACHPQSPWPHVEAAEDYCALKRWDEAKAAWQAALAIQPDQQNALLGLVRLARIQGDLAAGLKVLEALPHPPPGILIERSRLLNESGQAAQALAVLSSGAAQYPHDPEFLIESALIQRQTGDLDRARRTLESAAAVDPRNAKPWLKLSDFARQAHDQEAALGYLHHARDHCAPDIWVELCLAQVLFELGRYDECDATLAAANDKHHGHFLITLVRAEMLARRGRIAEAQSAVGAARVKAPAIQALTLLEAELAHRAGNSADAAIGAASVPAMQAEQRAGQLFLQASIAEEAWRRDDAAALYRAAEAASPSHRAAVAAQVRLALLAADLPLAEKKLLQWSRLEMPDRRARGLPAHVSQSFLGQFYEEYAFEPQALERIRTIMSEPAAQRLPRHRELALTFADWTPAASAWLLALREAGLLSRAGVTPAPSAQPAIPQRIVQYWYAAEPPADIAELMQTWRTLHPDWHYVRFDNAAARNWLSRHAPRALTAYVGTRDLAQKSDVLRLAVLAHEGGWYADADDRCVGPLASLPIAQAGFVAYQEEFATLGNNVLGAQPGHPVMVQALEDALAALERRDADIIWLSTGPGLLTRAFARALLSQGPESTGLLRHVAILTQPELRRAVATHCHANYKLTGQHWGDKQFKGAAGAARTSIRIVPK
jgi:tetratricopeptide (TPR) repeat protein